MSADQPALIYDSPVTGAIQQFSICKRPDGSRNRAVVDERRLVGPAVLDVPIVGVVTGVDHAAGEPAVERGSRGIEHALPSAVPLDGLGGFRPKPLRLLEPRGVDLFLGAPAALDRRRVRRAVHDLTRGPGLRPQAL